MASRPYKASEPTKTRWSAIALAALLGAATASTIHLAFGSVERIRNDHNQIKTDIVERHDAKAVQELQKLLESKVSVDQAEMDAYTSSPNTHFRGLAPCAVVHVESTQDVSEVVKLASRYRVPVVAFAGGTSIEGQIAASKGGIIINLSKMDKILQINEADGDLICQAGAGWQDINQHLEEQGIPLFFPLDPGPSATIGGMVATGCSGTNAVRYGTARAEWFLNLTVVMPDGSIIKTRSRARKSSVGFDLTKIFIGAEGTLGIVTEATLRLAPLLPTRVAVCSFPSVFAAVSCVVDVVNAGLPVQCAEYCDPFSMHALNSSKLCETRFDERDTVFFKFQGDENETGRMADKAARIIQKHNGTNMRFAKSKEESDEIWNGRKQMYWSLLAMNPGGKIYSTDVCVPLSKLPKLVQDTKQDFDACGIRAGLVAHAGDGNYHAGILYSTEEEFEKVKAAHRRLMDRAIALDGTVSGEHGIGLSKREYVEKELGSETVKVMRTVKDAIDPLGLFNPGKIFPDREV